VAGNVEKKLISRGLQSNIYGAQLHIELAARRVYKIDTRVHFC